MKLTDIKRDSDIQLAGIKAEVEWHDKSAKAVTLTDAEGHVLKVALTGFNNFSVLVPAGATVIERWRVAGRIPGIAEAVLEYHEYQSDADARVRALDSALRCEHELKVEKVNVTEAEADAHPPVTFDLRGQVSF